MTYSELQQFSKILYNNISFEDFQSIAEVYGYSFAYTKEMWRDFCSNALYFIVTHDAGRAVYEMIKRKVEFEKILN